MTLALAGIHHGFGNHPVLHGVDFTVRRGEVHALLGMNGAGKSTLLHLAAGVYVPLRGTVLIDGQPCIFRSPGEAAARGIVFMAQEVDKGLVPQLPVHENLTAALLRREGRIWFEKRGNRERARELLREYGLEVEENRPAGTLSLYEKQMLSIIRAAAGHAKYLLLDEPTASFDRKEAEKFAAMVERLKAQGIGIVLISHRLHEVQRMADLVSVLRDGRTVLHSIAKETDIPQLVAAMSGEERGIGRRAGSSAGDNPVNFSVHGLRRSRQFPELSLSVRKSEIVVVFGHLGSGKTWLARSLFGAAKPSYRARIDGVEYTIASTRQAARRGIVLVPEERGKQGIWKREDIRDHLSLGFRGFILKRRETAYSERIIKAFDIRPASPGYKVGALSGGNQQKVAIAKWATGTPKVAIFDEPMKGIDAAAKETIFRKIEEWAASGVSVLYMTAEPDDALRIADRILVLSRNRFTAEFTAAEATPARLFEAAEEEARLVGND